MQNNKYLVLKFYNAGLYRKNRNSKDKIFDLGSTRERKDEFEFIEPITVHQISNMLHVLFGERPVPTHRYVPYSKVDYIFEKAKDSYLNIHTQPHEIFGRTEYYAETVQLNKPFWNSWNPVSYMNWNRVKLLLEQELYDKFIGVTSEVLGYNVVEKTFNEVAAAIKLTEDARLVELFSELNTSGKITLYRSIYAEGNEKSSINANARTAITNLRGLDRVIRLSGQILVPVNNQDIERIKNGSGCVTLLDGGSVSIVGIKSANMLSPEGFVKVGDISIEKR